MLSKEKAFIVMKYAFAISIEWNAIRLQLEKDKEKGKLFNIILYLVIRNIFI